MTPADDVESVGGGIQFSTWGGTLTETTGDGVQGAYELNYTSGGYVYLQVTVPAGTSVLYSWDDHVNHAYDAEKGIIIDPARDDTTLMVQLNTPDGEYISVERYSFKLK